VKDAVGTRRVRVPALPDHLLAPLLEAAGETLRALDSAECPPGLRHLAAFDPRGLRTPAARQQLLRALEADDEFHGRVIDEFADRPEVGAALEKWDADAFVRLVGEAADRADLPLLASALYACRPHGWALGLGAAAVLVERQRVEQQDEDTRRARTNELESLRRSRQSAVEARAHAEAEVARLERDLRDERRSRRSREAEAERQAEMAATRVDDADAALARARAAVDAAEQRARRNADRARAVEGELHEARRRLAEREVPPDPDALVEAAELARRLADRLADVGARAERDRALVPGRRATGPGPVPSEPARRVRPPLPPGELEDSPGGLEAMLRSRGVVLVVDAYNVSMLGWGDAGIADQRQRLIAGLAGLHARTGCDVTLVFDGADVEGVVPAHRPGMRVVFSGAGEKADPVVVREVRALPNRVPVVVATSDAEVRGDTEREGAVVVSSSTLLSALRA
jgi:predicted RNA-binding protein with PIN domain